MLLLQIGFLAYIVISGSRFSQGLSRLFTIIIHEYSKGFIHTKTFVSDDTTATVGTTNLDFRSLYLHFECGTLLYGSTAVSEIKKDFLDTLQECQEITLNDCSKNVIGGFVQDILRLFAPLM